MTPSPRITPGIVYEGYVYGFHGHTWESGGPDLRRVELAGGKVMWEQPQAGSGTIIRFGDNLLILADTGELQLAKATLTGFKIRSRIQSGGPHHPQLSCRCGWPGIHPRPQEAGLCGLAGEMTARGISLGLLKNAAC